MTDPPPTTAQRNYDALRHIAKDYMGADELRRKAEKLYGVSFEEALEMAYENVLAVATQAIKGQRKPR